LEILTLSFSGRYYICVAKGKVTTMRNLGRGEWLLIVMAILLLFGARRLPDLARSLGKSLSEFKKGLSEGKKSETAEQDQDHSSKKES
jgi:sec-independent protein translocase protein TatA